SNSAPGQNRWDSQNHAMLGGGMGAWVFKGLGGITPLSAGYESILYRAGTESGLEFVNTSIETVRGTAKSEWRFDEGNLLWDITVPANSTAEIVIPFVDADAVRESGVNALKTAVPGLTYTGLNAERLHTFAAGSGSYSFEIGAFYTDKTALRALYNEHSEKQDIGYTTQSWSALAAALSDAQAALNDIDAEQTTIDHYLSALQTAVAGLALFDGINIYDEGTGIRVTAAGTVLPQDVRIEIGTASEGRLAELKMAVGKELSDAVAYSVEGYSGYDPVTPGGKVTYSIPLPEGYAINKLEVYCVRGTVAIDLDFIVKDGNIIVETAGFGEFVILQKSGSGGGGGNNPKGCGAADAAGLPVGACLFACAAIVIGLRRKAPRPVEIK
ncbi:MAG: hypothetical protein FWE62_04330, partial [Firmicutes bacterium]|nr:hypothetical protein [Bacillota bacterium]